MSVTFYNTNVESRLLLGTARYPSPAVLLDSIRASQTDIVTVSLRRESNTEKSGEAFWELIKQAHVRVLPNTAGCRSVKEAVLTANMARELFDTPWIKLEITHNDNTLNPAVVELIEAARILTRDGFDVFPYTTDDLSVADQLLQAGCQVLMPWGAPIGSGRGLNNVFALKTLRTHFPDVPLIVDAGLGVPSHAAEVLELGYDAVLLNTAVATAADPVLMASAFSQAVNAGRLAFEAGPMHARDFATPSTPVVGMPLWSA